MNDMSYIIIGLVVVLVGFALIGWLHLDLKKGERIVCPACGEHKSFHWPVSQVCSECDPLGLDCDDPEFNPMHPDNL